MPSKRGTRKVKSASSAASSWSGAQKRGYAKMNASNSRRIATTRMRNATRTSTRSRSGSGGSGLGRALGNSNPIDKLFYEIGNTIKRSTKR